VVLDQQAANVLRLEDRHGFRLDRLLERQEVVALDPVLPVDHEDGEVVVREGLGEGVLAQRADDRAGRAAARRGLTLLPPAGGDRPNAQRERQHPESR